MPNKDDLPLRGSDDLAVELLPEDDVLALVETIVFFRWDGATVVGRLLRPAGSTRKTLPW